MQPMDTQTDEDPSHWSKAPIRTRFLAALALVGVIAGSVLVVQSSKDFFRFNPTQDAVPSQVRADPPEGTSRQSDSRSHEWLYLSISILAGGVLLACAVAIAEVRRKLREGWTTPSLLGLIEHEKLPLGREIVWIGVHPQAIKRFHISYYFGIGVLVVAVAGIALLAARVDLDQPGGQIVRSIALICIVLILVPGLWALRAMKRSAASKIGVRESEILFDPGSGAAERSHWQDVRISSTHLLLGKRVLTVIDQWRRPLFPRDQLNGFLLSRLSPQASVSTQRLLLEALRRGNPMLWSGALLLGLYLGTIVLHEVAPELLSGMISESIRANK